MLNLLYAFKRLLRDRGLIRKLSLLFGASGDQVDAALDATSPVILGRLAEIAEADGGQEQLSQLLDNADPEVLSSASDFLERDNTENDQLLTDLFGDDRSGVTSGISDVSGVSTNTVGALLPKLSPMLLGFLARHRADNGADAAEMQRVVLSERDEIARTDRGSALLGLGTAGATAGGVAFFGSRGEDNPNRGASDMTADDTTDDTGDDDKAKPRRIHFEDSAAADADASDLSDADPGSDKGGRIAGAAALGGAAVAGGAAMRGSSSDDVDAEALTKKDADPSASATSSKATSSSSSKSTSSMSSSAKGADSKSYSYADKADDKKVGATTTATKVAVTEDEGSGLGWLWWLLGLLAALVVLGLILSQCGGDDDDDTGSEDAAAIVEDEDPPVVTTSSPPETTTAPTTTVAPTTTTTAAPTTTVAPTTTTTEAPPEPEPEAELGEPLTAGTLVGGFSLANAFAEAGGELTDGDTASSVASTGVEFAPFGPFNIDVGEESIALDWNEAPDFDELERVLAAGESDQYTFAFDDPVFAGIIAAADETQSLVPGVSQPDDNTVVVDFGEGSTFGDGQSALIVLTPAPEEGPAMESLPVTGVETNMIASVGVAFILLGIGLTAVSRRRELAI